jgi:hypothetical protein
MDRLGATSGGSSATSGPKRTGEQACPTSALGPIRPLLPRWPHDRCTPDSCRLVALRKSAGLVLLCALAPVQPSGMPSRNPRSDQLRALLVDEGQRSLEHRMPVLVRIINQRMPEEREIQTPPSVVRCVQASFSGPVRQATKCHSCSASSI